MMVVAMPMALVAVVEGVSITSSRTVTPLKHTVCSIILSLGLAEKILVQLDIIAYTIQVLFCWCED